MAHTMEIDPYQCDPGAGSFGRLIAHTDHDSGLSHSAIWRGINYIADMVMKVPCRVMRLNDRESYDPVPEHPAYQLLHNDANPLMSAVTWKHLAIYQAIWWGNHISWIQRDEDGVDPVALWPVDPNAVAIQLNPKDGTIRYLFQLRDTYMKVDPSDVFHIFGISNNGLWGLDFITYIRRTLRHGLILRDFSTRFFSTGANASGVLKFPPTMGPEQIEEYLQGFKKMQEGMKGSHSTIALMAGMEYDKLTIPPDSAQFLQTNELNDRQIANFLKIPTSIVGIKDSVAYASYEQHRQEVLDSGIDPWFVRVEDEGRRKLLRERQKRSGSHRISFFREALKRVAHKEKVEALAKEVESGLTTLNEARASLDRPSLEASVSKFADIPRKPKNTGYINDEDEEKKRLEEERRQMDDSDQEDDSESENDSEPPKKPKSKAQALAKQLAETQSQVQALSAALDSATGLLERLGARLESQSKLIGKLKNRRKTKVSGKSKLILPST